MIKNIVFDLGNVLLDFNPDIYLEKLGYSGKIKENLKSAIFETKEWLLLDRGSITEKEAIKKWKESNPSLKKEIEKIIFSWEKILKVKKDSLEILKKLADKDYNLYVLSNFHQKAFDYITEKYDFLNYFEGKIISAKVKMIKPEAEIYEHLLNKFDLKAAETLFIDDSKENIEAALKQGIRVIHFEDAVNLERELKLYLKKE